MNSEQKERWETKVWAANEEITQDELVLGFVRYEAVRKLTPSQFDELHKRNISGERFDDMVDEIIGGKNEDNRLDR